MPDAPSAPSSTAPPRVAVRLDYTRSPAVGEACPNEGELRGGVAAIMGYDPFNSAAAPLVRVAIARHGSTFVATLEHRDAAGRVLWSRPPLAEPDCRKLVAAIGLLVTNEIDPAQGHASRAAPPFSTVPPPVTEQPPSVPPKVTSSRPRIRLGARAAVAFGSAPVATAAFSADVGVGWEHFSISLEGRADVPVTAAVATGARLRTSLLGASLVPCGHYRWFAGCALFSVGALHAEGAGLAHPAGGSAVLLGAGVRAGLEWPLPFVPVLALRASADAVVNVHPINAARIDGREVWRTPPFAGLLGGGLVARF